MTSGATVAMSRSFCAVGEPDEVRGNLADPLHALGEHDVVLLGGRAGDSDHASYRESTQRAR